MMGSVHYKSGADCPRLASLGEPPYDRITNFGKANVTAADVSCTAGRSSCQQLRNSTIMAPITQSIA